MLDTYLVAAEAVFRKSNKIRQGRSLGFRSLVVFMIIRLEMETYRVQHFKDTESEGENVAMC